MTEQSFNNNNNSDDMSDADTMSHVTSNSFLPEKRAVFMTKQSTLRLVIGSQLCKWRNSLIGDGVLCFLIGESSDSGLDSVNYDKMATYVILETQERLEVVITPSTISVVKQILDSFSLKFNNILTDTQILSLKNDIAPHSTVILCNKSTVSVRKMRFINVRKDSWTRLGRRGFA